MLCCEASRRVASVTFAGKNHNRRSSDEAGYWLCSLDTRKKEKKARLNIEFEPSHSTSAPLIHAQSTVLGNECGNIAENDQRHLTSSRMSARAGVDDGGAAWPSACT